MARMKGKDIVKLLKDLKASYKDSKIIRYHIYAVIEQKASDSPVLDEVIESIQGYGTADVVHIEVIDEKNS